jgi:hypothetical protein
MAVESLKIAIIFLLSILNRHTKKFIFKLNIFFLLFRSSDRRNEQQVLTVHFDDQMT